MSTTEPFTVRYFDAIRATAQDICHRRQVTEELALRVLEVMCQFTPGQDVVRDAVRRHLK